MPKHPRRRARLTIANDFDFLPAVQTFTEKTALAFGLGQTEALALTLASEEIFNYLCTHVKPEAEIEINCYEGGYYAALDFLLPSQNLAMRNFNLTTTINTDDETSLDEMGLILASRMVEQLQIRQIGMRCRFILIMTAKSLSWSERTGQTPIFNVKVTALSVNFASPS